jgi:uncharacterized protein YbaR (Trm112 family)
MALSKELLGILACPVCKGPVTPDAGETGIVCRNCRLRYPVREGIPVMLQDEAEALGE